MRRSPILREVSDLVLPAILLFALYVQFHGDYGPGGGFQAGVIFAVGIILHSLIYGLGRTQRILRPRAIQISLAAGLLLYAGTGIVSMLAGRPFLDYEVFGHGHHGQERGILLVELGVGVTVASVMISVFFAFAGRSRGE